MRPVERGEWPVDPGSMLPIDFKEYGDARPHLTGRLGYYCSYCELRIANQPAVEHIHPKSLRPEFERMWCNLLLACASCNAIKGATSINVTDYLWPDQDNTARAIAYAEGGVVAVASGLPAAHAVRAGRTIELVGIDRIPGGKTAPSPSDQRWSLRRMAWDEACEAKARLGRCDSADMRATIVALARATGFWSVWMTVFTEDQDMRRRLIDAFPGTSIACFDEQLRPLPRPAGAL